MTKKSYYEELIYRHNIVSIMGGSDISIDPFNGSLMMSKRGRLMWQGKAHNAMFQFVRCFERNSPILKAQFVEFAARMDSKLDNRDYPMQTHSDFRRATETSREVSASSIFITLNIMLQTLKDELSISKQKFLNAEPLYSGQSFGNVAWVASNNARHADEWRVQWLTEKYFTDTQLRSVKVLASVLGYGFSDYRNLSGEICAPVLAAITNSDFDILERDLFTFANNLAVGVENNKGSATP